MSNEEQIRVKIAALCAKNYGDTSPTSMKKLFASYDGNGDGKISKSELIRILDDAGVSITFVPQSYVASQIISKIDQDGDGQITWPEYAKVAGVPAEEPAPPPPPPPAAKEPIKISPSFGDMASKTSFIYKSKASNSWLVAEVQGGWSVTRLDAAGKKDPAYPTFTVATKEEAPEVVERFEAPAKDLELSKPEAGAKVMSGSTKMLLILGFSAGVVGLSMYWQNKRF